MKAGPALNVPFVALQTKLRPLSIPTVTAVGCATVTKAGAEMVGARKTSIALGPEVALSFAALDSVTVKDRAPWPLVAARTEMLLCPLAVTPANGAPPFTDHR